MLIQDLSSDVLEALHERGLSDEVIESFTPEQLFAEYCNWHGLIGWGPRLIKVMDELRS